MGEEVRYTVEESIKIWEAQIDIHRDINRIYEKKKVKLEQHREELNVLHYLRAQVRKEPDAEGRLNKLQELSAKIDNSINFNIKKEIDKLIREIQTGKRRDKIVVLKTRLSELEKRIA